MVSSEHRELIKNYLTLTIWFLVHKGDNSISSKQFELVLKEIGVTEGSLKDNNVSQSAIEKLIDFAQQQVNTPITLLTENAQLRLCRLIFGEVRWSNE